MHREIRVGDVGVVRRGEIVIIDHNTRFCWRCDGWRELLAAAAIVALVLLAVLS
jgi:hypothetical protein